jgi:uncharacterized protein
MTKDQLNIIEATSNYVQQELAFAEGGHDWWHIYRVWKSASKMALEEGADEFIVQIAALLHDIADSKFHEGDENIGPEKATTFLKEMKLDTSSINHIEAIIRNMSFKNTFDSTSFNSIELDVVRDADRLDAIGAIGIARTFNYGGHKGSEIYNPKIKPKMNMTKDEYKTSDAPTINHFYEKLFLLKNMMTTITGKRLAEGRHKFMEIYLEQFYGEWDGRV